MSLAIQMRAAKTPKRYRNQKIISLLRVQQEPWNISPQPSRACKTSTAMSRNPALTGLQVAQTWDIRAPIPK